jgi:hypothetical protein
MLRQLHLLLQQMKAEFQLRDLFLCYWNWGHRNTKTTYLPVLGTNFVSNAFNERLLVHKISASTQCETGGTTHTIAKRPSIPKSFSGAWHGEPKSSCSEAS